MNQAAFARAFADDLLQAMELDPGVHAGVRELLIDSASEFDDKFVENHTPEEIRDTLSQAKSQARFSAQLARNYHDEFYTDIADIPGALYCALIGGEYILKSRWKMSDAREGKKIVDAFTMIGSDDAESFEIALPEVQYFYMLHLLRGLTIDHQRLTLLPQTMTSHHRDEIINFMADTQESMPFLPRGRLKTDIQTMLGETHAAFRKWESAATRTQKPAPAHPM